MNGRGDGLQKSGHILYTKGCPIPPDVVAVANSQSPGLPTPSSLTPSGATDPGHDTCQRETGFSPETSVCGGHEPLTGRERGNVFLFAQSRTEQLFHCDCQAAQRVLLGRTSLGFFITPHTRTLSQNAACMSYPLLRPRSPLGDHGQVGASNTAAGQVTSTRQSGSTPGV